MIGPELPFKIVVVTNLSGQPPTPLPKVKERRLITVDHQSFPVLFAFLKPQILIDNRPVLIKELAPPACEEVAGQLLNGGASPDEARALSHLVVRSPEYTAIRASWRNLRFLVESTNDLRNSVVQVWNVSKKEFLKELWKAPEFDWGPVFKRIYEDGIGTFGAEPVNLVILDFDVTYSKDDMELLGKASQVVAASAASMLVRVAPPFLDLDTWKSLNPDFQARFFNRAPRRELWCSIRREVAWCAFVFLKNPSGPVVDGELSEPWLDPMFSVAAAAARAFDGDNAGEPSSVGGERKRNGLDEQSTDSLADNLGSVGLNYVDPKSTEQALLDAVSVEIPKFPNHPTSLGRVLASCRIWHSLRVVIRNQAPSISRQVSAAGELLHTSERIRRLAHLNDLTTVLLEERGRLALRIDFLAKGHSNSSSIEFGIQMPTSVRQPPTIDSRKAQIRVLADLHGSTPPEPEYQYQRAVTFWRAGLVDDVFEVAYKHCPLGLKCLHSEGENDLRFTPSTLNDFSPERLVRFIPTCNSLLENRRVLDDLISFADERVGGWAVLENAIHRPGGVRALGSLLEAWISISGSHELAPVPPALVGENLGAWSNVDPANLEWAPRAILTYAKWIEGRPPRSIPSAETLLDTLDEIDELIGAQLKHVYVNHEFQRIERTWRGLSWLVDSAKNSMITMFELGFYSEPPKAIADIIREDWKSSRQILGTYDETTSEMKCVDIAVLDVCLTAVHDLEVIRFLSDLWSEERLVTICGIELNGKCRENPSAYQLEELSGVPLGRGVILVSGDFWFKGAFENESSACHRPWRQGGSATHPVFSARAVYAVAAVVGEVLQDFVTEEEPGVRRCLLNDRLRTYGLSCMPIGAATIVVPD